MAIRGNSDLRHKIKDALGISNPTMTRLLKENDDDLTKAASLDVIRRELNLTDEQILDKELVQQS
ncbi:MAG: hypothetical protein KDF60_19805 [Calditrichaeota bacterium]|nr:hypothetical protein [Calditrichota bacterium]